MKWGISINEPLTSYLCLLFSCSYTGCHFSFPSALNVWIFAILQTFKQYVAKTLNCSCWIFGLLASSNNITQNKNEHIQPAEKWNNTSVIYIPTGAVEDSSHLTRYNSMGHHDIVTRLSCKEVRCTMPQTSFPILITHTLLCMCLSTAWGLKKTKRQVLGYEEECYFPLGGTFLCSSLTILSLMFMEVSCVNVSCNSLLQIQKKTMWGKYIK